MENWLLNVHDSDPSTEGGPPGWLAFFGVAMIFLLVTAASIVGLCIWFI